jgi:hypothetical protein
MEVGELVPRAKAAREFGVSSRSVLNWEIERRPGFDQPIRLGNRVYHARKRLEAAKLLGLGIKPEEVA